MRDVNNGWLVRYLHANTASAFFFLVYFHIGRGIYYGSYKAPRTLTWVIGTVSAPKGCNSGSIISKCWSKSDLDKYQVGYRIFSPQDLLITVLNGIAENKSSIKGILFKPEFVAIGIRQGKVHELDTLKCHTPGGNILNRSWQYFNGSLYKILLAYREITTPFTTSLRFNRCKCLKRRGINNIALLRDLTAYDGLNSVMRRRSIHTRGKVERLPQDSKGYSLKQETQVTKVPKKKTTSNLTPSKVRKVGKSDVLATLVRKELLLYKDRRDTYNGLINILKNPEFLVACYENIRGKPGNMTKGSTNETLDGLTWEWFVKLGTDLSKGSYNFSPALRVLIPKANGKTRPLGINSPREKIVQKALTVILEQIWEDIFLNSSHGFRPKISVHSALKEIYIEGGNYNWVIQGDISKCFDSIPHEIILGRVGKRVKCQRTLELVKKALSAGYIDPETGTLVKSDTGTPQGSVLSPLLCNIVLHELDSFMEGVKREFHSGNRRRANPAYVKLQNARRYEKDTIIRRKLLQEMRKLRATDPMDPHFRRLKYVRYADDFVVLIIGTRGEATKIRTRIKDLLYNKCGLELNVDKTIISDIRREGFKFLGADCNRANMIRNHVVKLKKNISMRATTRMRMNIDLRKVYKKLVSIGVAKWDENKVAVPRGTANTKLINFSHSDIIAFYNSKARGLYSYYSFAGNRKRLGLVFWILKSSCALTLAKKYKSKTQGAIFKRFGELIECPDTGLKFFKPTTLRAIHDYKTGINTIPQNLDFLEITWAAKLTESNIKKVCILCGGYENIEMHHLRSVKDIKQKIRTGNATFAEWSGAFKRKQVPLCSYHHDEYHNGNLNHSDLRHISNFTKLN